MKQPGFCLYCGESLAWLEIGGRPRPVCTVCGWVCYLHLKVGAGVRIIQDGKLLLLRRTIDPYRGDWNLPAGYAEADEPPRRAAEREALEETGLRVQATQLVDVYFFADDPRGSGLLILYDCTVIGGVLGGGDIENGEACFFLPREIPHNMARGGHDQAVLAWKAIYDG